MVVLGVDVHEQSLTAACCSKSETCWHRNPAASIEALLGGWGEQPEQLRQGLADVALLYEPFDREGPAFELLIET